MDSHENARTTRLGRLLMVERLRAGWTVDEAAAAAGVRPDTVRKWRDRFAADGEAGLRDRSSRPHRSPRRLSPEREAEIAALRRERLSSPAIARRLGLPVSTVGVALRRLGLGRFSALEPRPEVIRYERENPGELIHLDIRGSAASTGSATASPATAAARATGAAPAGSASTSPSMTPRGSPTPPCCPTNARKAPSATSTTPSLGSRPTASPPSGS